MGHLDLAEKVERVEIAVHPQNGPIVEPDGEDGDASLNDLVRGTLVVDQIE